ncbi:hypothetical protein RFI_28556 [Reticulomyxa filosa]|uniref:Uncharacterized protein n=1 Tax=Reticulomyxa filosa TaxID=46433 RepID=X6M737_RETFI|nr:hypothetical protein RFI_28556 [Reticulomyxa filosa]|eukprot:ETO08830.1 hypothetical protein RFI_28556 [Reticulomyxa filosa]
MSVEWNSITKTEKTDQREEKYMTRTYNKNYFKCKNPCILLKMVEFDIDTSNDKLSEGIQNKIEQDKYKKEMEALIRLFGDKIEDENELKKEMEQNNGNVTLVIEKMVSNLLRQNEMEEIKHVEENADKLKKDVNTGYTGEYGPGINLQGYCTNETCLASKGKLLVWINEEFKDISIIPNKVSYHCPDCEQLTVTSVIKVMFFNSEHSIYASNGLAHINDNNYQCTYSLESELSYKLKANKIIQHAITLQDLINRSEAAMISNEIINLVNELEQYSIIVAKPSKIKDMNRLLEKIKIDYDDNFNRVFDIGRFTILCDNDTKLRTAVEVMKKAEKFNLIVSEDKDFFEKQSKTHHRFHNIKLYVPKYDLTLKKFTTLQEYTIIENPKLSHLFYEHIRAWKSKNIEEDNLKQASNETLKNINDIICEWIDDKEIQRLANRYKSHSDIGILKPSQLFKKNEEEINNNIFLKIIQFVYEQLCNFKPNKEKGKAIYVILYEYYEKYIIGIKNIAKSRKKEIEEDINILQALKTYIPLQMVMIIKSKKYLIVKNILLNF